MQGDSDALRVEPWQVWWCTTGPQHWEAEAGRPLEFPGQPELRGETLSKKGEMGPQPVEVVGRHLSLSEEAAFSLPLSPW